MIKQRHPESGEDEEASFLYAETKRLQRYGGSAFSGYKDFALRYLQGPELRRTQPPKRVSGGAVLLLRQRMIQQTSDLFSRQPRQGAGEVPQ